MMQMNTIGEFIMPRLDVSQYNTQEQYRAFIHDLIEKKSVGGFCIFGGTTESVPLILDQIQSEAKKNNLPPLVISCDCEWGLPMRLHKGGTEFPHLMALQRMNDLKGIFQVAEAIGKEMSTLGMHWNFAPVADINSNPNNPIINIRAFSGEPEEVAESAKSFYGGLEAAGIIATAKHFPGHGDTEVDSHNELPIINKTFAEFESTELVPFRFLSEAGIPSIMTGHIAAPKLAEEFGAANDEKYLPATISSALSSSLLRTYINYQGIIITDALEMFGLRKILSDPAEIAVKSFAAGADILLMPHDPLAAYHGVERAINTGSISSERIAQSSRKIVALKKKYLSFQSPKIDVQWTTHDELSQQSARNAIRLEGSIAKPLEPSSVFIISRNIESETRQREYIEHFFAQVFPNAKKAIVADSSSWGDKPLVVLLYRPRGMLTGDLIAEPMHKTVKELAKLLQRKKFRPLGVIAFGDPYLADEFNSTGAEFIMRTFSDSMPSIQAALQLLKDN